jgi:Na+/H+ antiporter NhaA
MVESAKVGILSASLFSALAGFALLRFCARSPAG